MSKKDRLKAQKEKQDRLRKEEELEEQRAREEARERQSRSAKKMMKNPYLRPKILRMSTSVAADCSRS